MLIVFTSKLQQPGEVDVHRYSYKGLEVVSTGCILKFTNSSQVTGSKHIVDGKFWPRHCSQTKTVVDIALKEASTSVIPNSEIQSGRVR